MRSKGLDDIVLPTVNENGYCPNTPINLSVSNSHGTQWSSGSNTNSSSYVSSTQNQLHWVKGISDAGCVFQDTFIIKNKTIRNINYTLNGLEIRFNNQFKNIDSLFWDFGDSLTLSNVKNPIHTYAKAGKYTIKLLTKDSCGILQTQSFILDFGKYILLSPKVFLQGPFMNSTGQMSDELRQTNMIPLIEPYSNITGFQHKNGGGLETTTAAVLNNNQNPTVVDWVFLELRDANNPSNVLTTKSALLLQNGNIVDVDGFSPVMFQNSDSAFYYIAIRHRNHLGIRTLQPFLLSKTTTSLDLTNNTTPLFGNQPMVYLVGIQTRGMIAADANSDGSIDALDTIYWENQNGLFNYYNNHADYNLDGSVDAYDSILWEFNNGKYQELD